MALEEKLSKAIHTQNVELELKNKALNEKERLLYEKQVQLDDRQKTLEASFREIMELKSKISGMSEVL